MAETPQATGLHDAEAKASDSPPIPRVHAEVRPRQGQAPGNQSGLTAIAEMTRALAWPLIVVSVLIWLRAPINKIVNVIPTKIERANRVSMFSLSLEEKAAARGQPRISEALNSLSERSLELFLDIGRSSSSELLNRVGDEKTYGLPLDRQLTALRELESHGLIDVLLDAGDTDQRVRLDDVVRLFESQQGAARVETYDGYQLRFPLPPDGIRHLRRYYYRLSRLGREALGTVIDAVNEQLGHAPAANRQTR